nr:hypothetical protein [Tanacetum cinerariifolium]
MKAKKESSDDEALTSGSDDKEYAMAVRNFKKFFRRKDKFVRKQKKKRSHFDKGMRRKERVTGNALDAVIQIISLAIVQNQLATKIKTNDETCLMAQSSNEIINKNTTLKTKRDLLDKEVLEVNEKIKKLKRSKEIDIACMLENMLRTG